MREPSSGGIGSRLNRNSVTLTSSASTTTSNAVPSSCTLKTMAANRPAIRKFTSGPAAATSAMPRCGERKCSGTTGTGFAQPIAKPGRFSATPAQKVTANMAVPRRSRCRIGFSDSRPIIFAVGSPSRHATTPCASSCSTIATSSTGSVSAKVRRSSTVMPEASVRHATLPGVRTGYQRSLALAALAAAVIAILFLAFGLVAGSGQ